MNKILALFFIGNGIYTLATKTISGSLYVDHKIDGFPLYLYSLSFIIFGLVLFYIDTRKK